jgi:ergothioneine biosynthesis protein EgtB
MPAVDHRPAIEVEPGRAGHDPEHLVERYRAVRRATEDLCQPLQTEDYVIQSMPDASPAKWHLAHTSWFFEAFLLLPRATGYRPFDERFAFLFNSYYVNVGQRHARDRRGLLSRPSVAEIRDYRHHVDTRLAEWIRGLGAPEVRDVEPLLELGLNHEQQHQELLLTDIKHAFWVNPLRPAYRPAGTGPDTAPPPLEWLSFEPGVRWFGHAGEGFAFDNESPRHRAFIAAFAMASRPVTNGEYRGFVEDGGYRRPALWLSDGWAAAEREQWEAPLYWSRRDGAWLQHTLGGTRRLSDSEPVCHVSLYEADAYARWAGARLPEEREWELAAESAPREGNFVESGRLHPAPPTAPTAAPRPEPLRQLFGDVWEWTRSPYSPYPGYAPAAGALGEYNGKFMCNQFVLRGGSCATPADHVRATYRNFFGPHSRWQFAGFRLARDP